MPTISESEASPPAAVNEAALWSKSQRERGINPLIAATSAVMLAAMNAAVLVRNEEDLAAVLDHLSELMRSYALDLLRDLLREDRRMQ